MSDPQPPRQPRSTRTFGPLEDLTVDADGVPGQAPQSTLRRLMNKFPFRRGRPTYSIIEEEDDSRTTHSRATERAPIPTMMQSSAEAYSTPLPKLSLIVLSITMLAEFLCANVSTPFLLFMVEGFGEFKDSAEVAFWTGILVSTFFLTQFLTSLLWATVAEKHGRRAVLMISLLGSALTCLAFGTATTLQQAICIRLLQGVFGGAVGVARGCVGFVTDQTNEGRAYAILGFCWGFGGVAGAIIGGSFERPADKWPNLFGNFGPFIAFPYLLPCAIAAVITLFGSFLSCFLGPDGGPREGAIRLLPEKFTLHAPIPEEEDDARHDDGEDVLPSPVFEEDGADSPRGIVQAIPKKLSRKFSNLFAKRVPMDDSESARTQIGSHSGNASVPLSSTPQNVAGTPQMSGIRIDRTRTFSRTSTNLTTGSAYGYGASYRARLASNAALSGRRNSLGSSLWRRRGSRGGQQQQPGDGQSGGDTPPLNFAQRLLLANENAVTNIADLWVAAAMNVDNEDPFENSDEEDGLGGVLNLGGAVEEEDDEPQDTGATDDNGLDHLGRRRRDSRSTVGTRTTGRSPGRFGGRPSFSVQPGSAGRPRPPIRSPSPATRFGVSAPSGTEPGSLSHRPSFAFSGVQQVASRRSSTSVPTIFSHSGVNPPLSSGLGDGQTSVDILDSVGGPLAPISESRAASAVGRASVFDDVESGSRQEQAAASERPPSLWAQLPILVIVQYGVMALHTTSHDQIFMSYLVSDYKSGGLGLNAGNFAQLIALMCLAQIIYQFYLYPNIGPPRGRFSHLAMFRIGTIMFIPAYLSVTLYRPFASREPGGEVSFLMMAALSISTAIRYCGTTFGYTAISILLNYMTPPQSVGYANGIAQSIVSLARCVGPVIGGSIWSVSVQDGPGGYYKGFFICAGVCALTVFQSLLIR